MWVQLLQEALYTHKLGIVKLVEYYVVTVKTGVRVPLPALFQADVA